MLKHVLKSQQFSREFLEDYLFEEADSIKLMLQSDEGKNALRKVLQNKLMLSLFFEPSSRTRFSFEVAAKRLGMDVLSTENAEVFSSFAKGESLEDGIRVMSSFSPDCLVIRHHETGSLERAALASSAPVINAGDGQGQHPTQSLLDLYTIRAELGSLDYLTVALGGDLKHGRTVRSLAYMLSKFKGIRLIFVSVPDLKICADIKTHLHEKNVSFVETEDSSSALKQADVIYWTRTQKERITSTVHGSLNEIGLNEMSWMKPKSILLHPLPRNTEINPDCDTDPRSAYFRQAENGLYVRSALLKWVMS